MCDVSVRPVHGGYPDSAARPVGNSWWCPGCSIMWEPTDTDLKSFGARGCPVCTDDPLPPRLVRTPPGLLDGTAVVVPISVLETAAVALVSHGEGAAVDLLLDARSHRG